MGRFYKEPRICIACGNEFVALDVKTKRCSYCRELIEISCSCGCGVMLHRVRYKVVQKRLQYAPGCRVRGRTYAEIYNGESVRSGFKKGDANIGRFYARHNASRVTNKYGEQFHSKLEARFAELLTENSIGYRAQVPFKLLDGKWKIVDFVVPYEHGDILIEISGFAHKNWRDDFRVKIQKLRQSVDNQIILLTYATNLNTFEKECCMTSVLCGRDLYVGSVEDETRILRAIAFSKGVNWMNHRLREARCL